MIKGLFKKPKNDLEPSVAGRIDKPAEVNIHHELCTVCQGCKKSVFSSDLQENDCVCPNCGKHLRLNTRQRIHMIADPDSFRELWADMSGSDPLGFPDYEEKLRAAELASREAESVVTGTVRIGKNPAALFVMEPAFMMGSMGTVTGEKITRLFEYATEKGLPVVGFTASGGARMQEGMLSLMQMAKTSGAVKRFSDAGGFYLAVLTDPTTGGVTASFAMEADVIAAEPDALICFAGPRVIEQTIRQKLPPGLGRAESLLKNGFIDKIVPRREQKKFIARMLRAHRKD
ncbi:MAG: acetyl-CoA carboxylase, carboxyltransferase subunit beta [Eubacteriales bacterium]|nr:acetyl-CoA carboxylase, carboxyltransferase subunit beta [Eubacteriales bacterium]